MKSPADPKRDDKDPKQNNKDPKQGDNKKRGIVNDAQNIVSSALDVLEKEVAAGILAAKKLERNVMDVDEIRKNNPSELMERIRKDAYAVVDLLLDAATMVMHQVETLTENLNKTQAATTPAPAPAAPASFIPVLKNDLPAAPGTTVDIPMMLQNHDAAKPSTVLLSKPDLKDPQGNTIAARNIRVKPESAALKPNGTQMVSILVKVPKTTPAGVYSGLFQDQNNASTCAVLILTVS